MHTAHNMRNMQHALWVVVVVVVVDSALLSALCQCMVGRSVGRVTHTSCWFGDACVHYWSYRTAQRQTVCVCVCARAYHANVTHSSICDGSAT